MYSLHSNLAAHQGSVNNIWLKQHNMMILPQAQTKLLSLQSSTLTIKATNLSSHKQSPTQTYT